VSPSLPRNAVEEGPLPRNAWTAKRCGGTFDVFARFGSKALDVTAEAVHVASGKARRGH
jgi:hypothetical protein